MRNKSIEIFLGSTTMTIVEAMQKIDNNECGVLFITDKGTKLLGSLTDGDIRRWLIKTGDLQTKVSAVMNKNPKTILKENRKNVINFLKANKIKAVPIIDENDVVVDVVVDDLDKHDNISKTSNLLQDINVIIMAGGKGTRLYPYTKILPKPLIPIGDIPILERIMDRFCSYGVKNYYITVNYKKSMIKSYFAELNPRYSIQYVEEDRPLGTAGSINLINEEFNTDVFVTNCDTLIEADYEDILLHHRKSGNALTVISSLKNVKVPYGVLHYEKNGIINKIEEKPSSFYFINTGMYVLKPEYLKWIPKDTMYHMTDLIEKLLESGVQVGMYPISEESFLDMGEIEEMHHMEEKLKLK